MDVHGPIDLRLKFGTNSQIVGMSSSGKTWLALGIALHRNCVYNQKIDKCIFLYNQYQQKFDDVKKRDPNIIFTNSIDELEQYIESGESLLVIFDDFLLQMCSELNEYMNYFFVQRSHHANLSTIVLQQVLYAKNGRTMNLNTHYLILFKQTKDARQIYFLGQQMLPENSKFLYNAYKMATQDALYSYFVIDSHPATPDYARFRNSVFVNNDLVFFLPKWTGLLRLRHPQFSLLKRMQAGNVHEYPIGNGWKQTKIVFSNE